MDWGTFIKWNGIVYTTWYGVNLLVDYLLITKSISPSSSETHYDLKQFGIEEPMIVLSEDYKYEGSNSVQRSSGEFIPNSNEPVGENRIHFNAPIERQGLPVEEFLKTAHQFSSTIFNQ